MGFFSNMFKSKEDKAIAKADKAVDNLSKKISSAEKMRNAEIRAESAKKGEAALKEKDYKLKVIKAEAALSGVERDTRAALVLAINELQQELSKGEYTNPSDVKEYKQNMKNIFYKLVTIKRNQKTLEQAKRNHMWERSMQDLSNTYKLMNLVNGAEDGIIKKKLKTIAFLYRKKKVEKTDDFTYYQMRKYFGKDSETEISESIYLNVAQQNILDLMVDDCLFTKLTDAAMIDNCLSDPTINKVYPDDLAKGINELNNEAMKAGDAPVLEGLNTTVTQEELERIDEMIVNM